MVLEKPFGTDLESFRALSAVRGLGEGCGGAFGKQKAGHSEGVRRRRAGSEESGMTRGGNLVMSVKGGWGKERSALGAGCCCLFVCCCC